MAEALAIVGSLAAIAQLAKYGNTFVVFLRKRACKAGSAMKEMEGFATLVGSSSGAIDAAVMMLQTHFRDHPTSVLLQYVFANDLVMNLERMSEDLVEEIRAAKNKVRHGVGSRYRWMTAIKWELRKESILDLTPAIESIKGSLTLLMLSARFETVHEELSSQSVLPTKIAVLETEMRKLKELIHDSMASIVHHISQIDPENKGLGGIAARFRSDRGLGPSSQDILRNLEQAIVQRATIPAPTESFTQGRQQPPIDRESPRSSGGRRRSNGNHRLSTSSPIEVADQPPSRPVSNSTSSSRSRNTNKAHTSRVEDPPTRPAPAPPSPPRLFGSESEVGKQPHQPPARSGGALRNVAHDDSRHTRLSLEVSHGIARVVHPRICSSMVGFVRSRHPGSAAVSPSPSSSSSPTPPSSSSTSTPGEVRRHRWTRTSADIIPTLTFNVMSLAKATALQLEIDPAFARLIVVQIDGVVKESVGQTTFEWKEDKSSQRRCFTVTCAVIEKIEPEFILGRPFVTLLARSETGTSAEE